MNQKNTKKNKVIQLKPEERVTVIADRLAVTAMIREEDWNEDSTKKFSRIIIYRDDNDCDVGRGGPGASTPPIEPKLEKLEVDVRIEDVSATKFKEKKSSVRKKKG
jgi:hypothetical protein